MSEPKIFDAVTYNPDGTKTYFQYVRIEDYDSLKVKADKLAEALDIIYGCGKYCDVEDCFQCATASRIKQALSEYRGDK